MKKNSNTKDKKKKKKRSIIGTFLKILLILVLLVILGVAGYIGWNYYKHKDAEVYDPLSAAALGVDPEMMKMVLSI